MSVTQDEMNERYHRETLWNSLGVTDWLWAALVLLGTGWVFYTYGAAMDIYEQGIMAGTGLSMIWLGWKWKPLQPLSIAIAVLSLFALSRYGNQLAAGETDFFLKYILASQSAIMWMSALFVMATATYFIALFARSEFTGSVASAMTWSATTMGMVGLLVRWRETYLVNPDFGHIPVSNLYEVFVLFAIITAMIYLYYEGRYRTRAMGGFVLLVISSAVAFLLWYSFTREAHAIEPLVPALQSYWMKIHVPANFVGYGAFALAAMIGVAQLHSHYYRQPSRPVAVFSTAGVFVIAICWQMIQQKAVFATLAELPTYGYALIVTVILVAASKLLLTARVQENYPSITLLEDVQYKSIALGFAFFTVATILGALWAAEAWGGYWSWDPKETWALIVWLNYAAWLHMRLTKGWRGAPMAWWSIVGLFVTLFAFLGVNMFLSGLHSYGEL